MSEVLEYYLLVTYVPMKAYETFVIKQLHLAKNYTSICMRHIIVYATVIQFYLVGKYLKLLQQINFAFQIHSFRCKHQYFTQGYEISK
jgi:hypothetical protein